MKILFLMGKAAENNANSNCIKNLIDILKNYHNIGIVMLSNKKSVVNEGNVVKYTLDCENTFLNNLKNILKMQLGLKVLFQVFQYIMKKLVLKTPFGKYFPSWFCNAESILPYTQLKKIVTAEKYDCVISVSFPFKCHYLASMVKQDLKDIYWCAYYLDPYSFNVTNKYHFGFCKKFEDNVLEIADKIILTKKMYSEFSSCQLSKHLNKSIVCEFPNLKRHNVGSYNNTIKFDKNTINCVFVGYLYSTIRSPRFFLELLSECSENIKFYIVGGFASKKADFNLSLAKDKLKYRMEIVDAVPLDEAFRIMNDADVLVNIGNSIQNQLPSKIFDYISIGKPIVNIVKVDNCQTLEYMDKYPMALNIFEKDGVTKTVISEFENFCNEKKGKKVPFDEVKRLYETSTPEYVAKQFRKIIG